MTFYDEDGTEVYRLRRPSASGVDPEAVHRQYD